VRGRLAFPFRALPVAAGPAAVAELAGALRNDALGARRGLAHPRVGSHLETTILALLLSAFPHSLQDDYDRAAAPCAPYYVRRAEQYIEAHLRDPVGIDDLVAVAGVSVRSLFGGFRRFRATTPMAYLKAARLDLARVDLACADPGRDSVTDIAIACGFTHMSKFARDFKARFGLSPSQALGRRN
jgi:AraC-like DNA-binding protein